MAEGPLAALDDRPRPGREPMITLEARHGWFVGVSEGDGTGLSARTVDDAAFGPPRSRAGTGAGACVPRHLAQGTVRKILDQEDVKPHKVRYYLEQRGPEFAEKMAEVLCVYRQVRNFEAGRSRLEQEAERCGGCHFLRREAGYSGHRNDGPRLPPVPGVHATFAREHEYKRHGTISLLAGIDLLTGKVHALVKDRHRSREFIEFLKLLDATYPAHTAIKLILDNHSAHISKETKAWLADQPAHRFEFTFTPKHGSWLNLVEGFFSKPALRSASHPRHIKTGTQGSHHGCHGRIQPTSRRPHLVL